MNIIGKVFLNKSRYISPISQVCTRAANETILAKQKSTVESFGQPTPQTHPHLLKADELVQGITLEEIKTRRIALLENVHEHGIFLDPNLKNNLIIIPSSVKRYMSEKIPYVFRQNSDFMYLSGCLEPDSVLVLERNENKVKSILFMRPKDKKAELWDGPRTGVDNATEFFVVDEAYNVADLHNYLKKFMLANKTGTIWYDQSASSQPGITDFCQTAKVQTKSPTSFIHKLRVIKSEAEIGLMRKTCEIAAESINKTIQNSHPGISEHHIFAEVDYQCRMRNASFLAYPPVIAGGVRATTIHYINNSQIVNDGEMVLMDAGCEYGGYSSDITRTWPINGVFTPPQRILYEVLLVIQKELMQVLQQENGKSLDDLFDVMCLRIGFYLQELGFIPKTKTGHDLARAAYSFCPHHVSHYLGMDVHDCASVSRSINVVPNMIFTIEPGIYISADRTDVPKEFRGIGLRIEDDVLVNANGKLEILTDKCVKEINEIEQLFRSQSN